MIVKGVASHFHERKSVTHEWMSFASTMAASVVAKMLSDPTVFLEWPHLIQGKSYHGKKLVLGHCLMVPGIKISLAKSLNFSFHAKLCNTIDLQKLFFFLC